MPQLEAEQPRQIIGIVADQRDGSLNQDPGPEIFIPSGQATDAIQALNVKLTPLAWVIRTRGEPMRLRAAVEEQLRQVSGLPVSDIRTMGEVVSRSTSRERFHMLLMSVFGGVSLLLAAIGIYGLMAYTVEQRTQEIGIRMALGAGREEVRAMVMQQGMAFAVIGVLVGMAGAFVLAEANLKLSVWRDRVGSVGLRSDSSGSHRNGRSRRLVARLSSDTGGSGHSVATGLRTL